VPEQARSRDPGCRSTYCRDDQRGTQGGRVVRRLSERGLHADAPRGSPDTGFCGGTSRGGRRPCSRGPTCACAATGPQAVSAASTKTGKSHVTFRRAIGLLHPAGSSSAGRAPLSFNDVHFCQREQRPAKREKRARRPRARHGALDAPGANEAIESCKQQSTSRRRRSHCWYRTRLSGKPVTGEAVPRNRGPVDPAIPRLTWWRVRSSGCGASGGCGSLPRGAILTGRRPCLFV
jgi:hypothetical protein